MRRTRQNFTSVGQGIKTHLATTELSLDQGLIAQANLMAAVLSARIEFGMEGGYQRDLIRETGAALAHSLAGRERMLDLHQRLSGVAMKLGLEPRAFGDGDDKDKPAIVPEPALALVGTPEERVAA